MADEDTFTPPSLDSLDEWTPDQQAVVNRIQSGRQDFTFGPGSPNPTNEDLNTYVGGRYSPASGFAVHGGVALAPSEYKLFSPDQRLSLGIMDIAPADQKGKIERYYATPDTPAGIKVMTPAQYAAAHPKFEPPSVDSLDPLPEHAAVGTVTDQEGNIVGLPLIPTLRTQKYSPNLPVEEQDLVSQIERNRMAAAQAGVYPKAQAPTAQEQAANIPSLEPQVVSPTAPPATLDQKRLFPFLRSDEEFRQEISKALPSKEVMKAMQEPVPGVETALNALSAIGATTPEEAKPDVVTSEINKQIAGLASPVNIGLMVGTFGVGGITSRLLAAGFSAQAAGQGIQDLQQFALTKYPEERQRLGVRIAASGIITALGGFGALHGVGEVAPKAEAIAPAPIEKPPVIPGVMPGERGFTFGQPQPEVQPILPQQTARFQGVAPEAPTPWWAERRGVMVPEPRPALAPAPDLETILGITQPGPMRVSPETGFTFPAEAPESPVTRTGVPSETAKFIPPPVESIDAETPREISRAGAAPQISQPAIESISGPGGRLTRETASVIAEQPATTGNGGTVARQIETAPTKPPGVEGETGTAALEARPQTPARSFLEEQQPGVSAIANRFTRARILSGDLGEVNPGRGASAQEMVALGQKLVENGADVDQAVSRVNSGTYNPVDDAAVVRFEEARLRARKDQAYQNFQNNPQDVNAQRAYEDSFKYLTDFHRGPIAQIKVDWHKGGAGLMGQFPVDLSTADGLREAWLQSTSADIPNHIKPIANRTAARVRNALDAEERTNQKLTDAIDQEVAKRKGPNVDELRDSILSELEDRPCL